MNSVPLGELATPRENQTSLSWPPTLKGVSMNEAGPVPGVWVTCPQGRCEAHILDAEHEKRPVFQH